MKNIRTEKFKEFYFLQIKNGMQQKEIARRLFPKLTDKEILSKTSYIGRILNNKVSLPSKWIALICDNFDVKKEYFEMSVSDTSEYKKQLNRIEEKLDKLLNIKNVSKNVNQ